METEIILSLENFPLVFVYFGANTLYFSPTKFNLILLPNYSKARKGNDFNCVCMFGHYLVAPSPLHGY